MQVVWTENPDNGADYLDVFEDDETPAAIPKGWPSLAAPLHGPGRWLSTEEALGVGYAEHGQFVVVFNNVQPEIYVGPFVNHDAARAWADEHIRDASVKKLRWLE